MSVFFSKIWSDVLKLCSTDAELVWITNINLDNNKKFRKSYFSLYTKDFNGD